MSEVTALERLQAALRSVASEVDSSIDAIRASVDSGPLEPDVTFQHAMKLRLAPVLLAVLRRLVQGASPAAIYEAFGAPGDFGYDTQLGSALDELYRFYRPTPTASPDAVVKLGAVLVNACAGLPDDHRFDEDLPVADVLREMAAAAVREVDHHKRLLAAVTTERDQLQAAAQKLVASAAACDAEAERHPSSRSSAPMVRYIGALERLKALVSEKGEVP